MSYVKLSKFPVTAPDGTEYRVTIEEVARTSGTRYANVTLYVRKRWFGFRKVYERALPHRFGVYDADIPDFIKVVTWVFEQYDEILGYQRYNETVEAEKHEHRRSTISSLKEWDGRIAE